MAQNNYENSFFISACDRFQWIPRSGDGLRSFYKKAGVGTSVLSGISRRMQKGNNNLSLFRGAAKVLGRLPLVIVDLKEGDVLGDLGIYSDGSDRAFVEYINYSLGFTSLNLRSDVKELYEAIDDVEDPLKILFFPDPSILDFKRRVGGGNIICETQSDFAQQYLGHCIDGNKINDGSLTDFEKIILKNAMIDIGIELNNEG